MIVAVSGSRTLREEVSRFMPAEATKIITGGAPGIDHQAEAYARRKGLELEVIRPDYQKYYYKAAPLERNKEIVNRCDVLVAIWDGKSKGTKFTIDYAKKIGKDVRVYIVKGEN